MIGDYMNGNTCYEVGKRTKNKEYIYQISYQMLVELGNPNK